MRLEVGDDLGKRPRTTSLPVEAKDRLHEVADRFGVADAKVLCGAGPSALEDILVNVISAVHVLLPAHFCVCHVLVRQDTAGKGSPSAKIGQVFLE